MAIATPELVCKPLYRYLHKFPVIVRGNEEVSANLHPL